MPSTKFTRSTSAKVSAKASAKSEAELGSSQNLPRLGWNLPREEASSPTEGAGFATLYVCVGMAMIAVVIRTKRESLVRAIESYAYSPLEEEEKNTKNRSAAVTYGTRSEEESSSSFNAP